MRRGAEGRGPRTAWPRTVRRRDRRWRVCISCLLACLCRSYMCRSLHTHTHTHMYGTYICLVSNHARYNLLQARTASCWHAAGATPSCGHGRPVTWRSWRRRQRREAQAAAAVATRGASRSERNGNAPVFAESRQSERSRLDVRTMQAALGRGVR